MKKKKDEKLESLCKGYEIDILQPSLDIQPQPFSISSFFLFSVFIIVLLSLVICATIYEESLVAKGINLYDNDDDVMERKKKAASIHCENNNSKYEMNHINNNNNNEPEYEMSKVHQESDLHKLGECRCRHILTECDEYN
jgi:hypothetical protein